MQQEVWPANYPPDYTSENAIWESGISLLILKELRNLPELMLNSAQVYDEAHKTGENNSCPEQHLLEVTHVDRSVKDYSKDY